MPDLRVLPFAFRFVPFVWGLGIVLEENHIQWLAASAEPRHWYPAATAELVREYQAAGDKAETDTAEETPGAATDTGSPGVQLSPY